jgi:hypothetical protein
MRQYSKRSIERRVAAALVADQLATEQALRDELELAARELSWEGLDAEVLELAIELEPEPELAIEPEYESELELESRSKPEYVQRRARNLALLEALPASTEFYCDANGPGFVFVGGELERRVMSELGADPYPVSREMAEELCQTGEYGLPWHLR